jgi:hypothetical protein
LLPDWIKLNWNNNLILLTITSEKIEKGEYQITLKSHDDMNLRQFNIIVNDKESMYLETDFVN